MDYILIGIIVFILCLWTYDRNRVWQTSVGLWEDCYLKSPGSYRVNSNLAAEYILAGRFQDAVIHCQKALKIDDKQYYIYYNLSISYQHLGNLSDAYKMGRRAVVIYKNTTTLTQLGFVLKQMGWKVGDQSPQF